MKATVKLVKSNRRDHHRHPFGFSFRVMRSDDAGILGARDASRGYYLQEYPYTWIALAVCEVRGIASIDELEHLIPVGRGYSAREALHHLVKVLRERGLLEATAQERIPTMPPGSVDVQEDSDAHSQWRADWERIDADEQYWARL